MRADIFQPRRHGSIFVIVDVDKCWDLRAGLMGHGGDTAIPQRQNHFALENVLHGHPLSYP